MTHPSPIRLLVHGARGKMGARIIALAQHDPRFRITHAIDRDDNVNHPTTISASAVPSNACDVVIDFSSDDGAQNAAAIALRHHAALLVGTTGLSDVSQRTLRDAAAHVPVMIAPNTSLGVAVLNHLVAEAARLLGQDYEIDLIESHHNQKKDAPSGTARRLLHTLRERLGRDLADDRVHSIRAGEIIGEHTVQFAGPGEIISLSHSATSRDLFARGALRAAAWLRGKPAGMYSIEQSLGV